MNALTFDRARQITQELATPAPPAARPPQRPYAPIHFTDPHDMPEVRYLEGLDALLAWHFAGGDTKLLQGRTA